MLNPAHILETALLLLAAFLIGATLGTVAKLAFRATRRRPAAVAPAPVAVAPTVEAAALVTAPAIDPISKPELPAAPANVASPDFTEMLVALAGNSDKLAPMPEVKLPALEPVQDGQSGSPLASEMEPARAAGETTSGIKVPSPVATAAPTAEPTADGPVAEVIPFPTAPAPAVPGAEAIPTEIAPVPEPQSAPVDPVPSVEPVQPIELVTEPVIAPVAEVKPPSASEASEETVSSDFPPEASLAASERSEPPPAEPEAAPQPRPAERRAPATDEDDEAAAMRAIEGSWSPRRSSVSPARAELPEDADSAVDTSRNAVLAAAEAVRVAAEQVGKPVGIDAPRDGRKDELTNVIGVLPIIETALNSLGLYHFDQVAGLSDEEVQWVEAHLGIEGRIAREHWREQARELATAPRSRLVAGS